MSSKNQMGGLFLFFKRNAGKLIRLKIKLPRFISRMLYRERMFRKHAWPFLKAKLYYENMMRFRCNSVGDNFVLYGEIPWITGSGNITIGDNVVMQGKITLFTGGHIFEEPEIIIGDGSDIGFMVQIRSAQKVVIGKNCMIAGYVIISDNDGHPIEINRRRNHDKVTPEETAPVIIEDDVWIGEHSIIMKGVTIGKGSIITAGSVVTKSIPPMKIVMGNPGRVAMWVPDSEASETQGG